MQHDGVFLTIQKQTLAYKLYEYTVTSESWKHAGQNLCKEGWGYFLISPQFLFVFSPHYIV